MTSGSFSETSLPHLLSDVNCQGSETNLLQCQYSNTVSCGTTEDAAVVCQGGYKCICIMTDRVGKSLQLILCAHLLELHCFN